MKKIGIIDYGVGNLKSLHNALVYLGFSIDFLKTPDELSHYDRLLLPGVGAFGGAIKQLRINELDIALNTAKDKGQLILGVCLGLQLMCLSSEEGGYFAGLGWFNADVKRFSVEKVKKIPHMGWNNLKFTHDSSLQLALPQDPDVYFVHSYRAVPHDVTEVGAWCDYGGDFAAILVKENIASMQFHPEKSQEVGLTLLKNFFE